MAVKVTVHHGEVRGLRSSPGVARDLARRGRNVETRAKQLAPVDTGRLRSSITSYLERRSDGVVCVVEAQTNYAQFVHDGTRFMRANPFLLNALPAAKD